MSDRVCRVSGKLIVLSMLVITMGAGGCTGSGLRIGATAGTTSSTAGATGAAGGSAGTTVDLTSTSGGTTASIGNTGGGGMPSTTVGIPAYAGTVSTTGGITGITGGAGGGGTMVTSAGTTGTTGGMNRITGGAGTGGSTSKSGSSGGVGGSGGTAGVGGKDGGTVVDAAVEQSAYAPAVPDAVVVLQGVFVPTGSMTVAREGHTATLLPNGMVLIAGGEDDSGILASAELYDPADGTFTATGSMTEVRAGHTATLLPNGKVLIASGLANLRVPTGPPSAELYDPAVGTFTTAGTVDAARGGHTATLLPNGKVLFAGGTELNNEAGTWVTFASTELYDPISETFTATGSMTAARSGHTATLLPSGKVLIASGYDDVNSYGVSASAELYDPSAGTSTATGSMAVAAVEQAATLLPSGKVLITGGNDGSRNYSPFASAELYDPAAGTFTATSNMSVARAYHTAALLPSGKVLIAGGASDSNTTLMSAELYDPAAGTFTATGSMTTTRSGHTATLLPSGKVLIAGGLDNDGNSLASAELYEE